jgi:predicted phage gp36 major capsid-like protein
MMKDLQETRGTLAGRQDSGVELADVDKKKQAKQLDDAFDVYLRHGPEGLNPEQRGMMSQRFVREGAESRTAQTVTTTGGGYLIPQGFSDKLEESLKFYGGVEQAATVFETETGNTLPYPTVDDTSNTGRLLAINTAATETAVTYGVINFAAYKFSLRHGDGAGRAAAGLGVRSQHAPRERLGDSVGPRAQHVSDDGHGLVAAAGYRRRFVERLTAAGASTVTYDELLALEHSIDPAYRNKAFGAGFMFNDGTLLKLRQMKDGEGRPLWQAGTPAARPTRSNGWPYVINQDMAAMTTGLKPILFGALKKFKVRKVKGFTLLRLSERYAELHQVAFLAFTRMDRTCSTRAPIRASTSRWRNRRGRRERMLIGIRSRRPVSSCQKRAL